MQINWVFQSKSLIYTSSTLLVISKACTCGLDSLLFDIDHCLLGCFTVRSAIAEWDLDETKAGGPFKETLGYDILVNCILLMEVYLFRCRSLVFVL